MSYRYEGNGNFSTDEQWRTQPQPPKKPDNGDM